MSLITRTNPLRFMAKRNVSIAMTSDLQASQSQPQDHQHQHQHSHNDQTMVPSQSNLTLSQFTKQKVSRISKFQNLESRTLPHHNRVALSPVQIEMGSHIRECLNRKDHQLLVELTKEMNKSKHFDPLVYGLTRHEITEFFKILISAQLKELSLHDDLKFIASKEERRHLIASGKEFASTITNFYESLKSFTSIEFTPYEYELFLKFEVENYRYTQALELITYLDSVNFPKTINYWNLKLKVLGDANPGNWTIFDTPFTLSKRGFRGGLQKQVEFGSLLTELSEDIGNVIPNMETHRLILLGAGKNNNMELVRHHIKDFWGIAEPGESSKNLPKVGHNSPCYPDIQLMETLVATFGVNNQLVEVMHYTNEFQTYYKGIDLSKGHHFWKLLMNWTNLTHADEPQVASEIFDSIWTLMKRYNVKFNVTLFDRRREVLTLNNELKELIKDMNNTKEKASNTFDTILWKKLEYLLTKQYESSCKVAFTTLMDEKFDLVELGEMVALDSNHLKNLKEVYAQEYKIGVADRVRFEELQQEYDEQDEEDSLW